MACQISCPSKRYVPRHPKSEFLGRKGLERSSEAKNDAPQRNADEKESKICERPRNSNVAVLSARNKASNHHGTRRHEQNSENERQCNSKLEAFWISAEFGPTSVLLGNEFMTDFMKQKRRTDGNQHHRHGEEEQEHQPEKP